MEYRSDLKFAHEMDAADPLKEFRHQFHHPFGHQPKKALYFAGHSLGLMPKTAENYLQQELEDWKSFGVEGHFQAKNPWLSYHELLTPLLANLVGAKEEEVVAMNTLTVNLHLMLVSFYKPTNKRFKILIENNTFPSDKYAVDSQARFHGHDPKEAVIQLSPEPGQKTIAPERVIETIEKHKDELSLVMLGNVNYLSGQYFDIEEIVKVAKVNGIAVGFNLAHGAGNLLLKLHDWQVDFAVWCSYKYLNSGPGGLAGCFVHQDHLGKKEIPRFEGWWGHDKSSRFMMGPEFQPIPTAEAWQLSNPPIFQLATMRASLEIFDNVGMQAVQNKSILLTSYMEYLLKHWCAEKIKVVTPARRGSMLCLEFSGDSQKLLKRFKEEVVICDFRRPDILRMTPIPLYNSFEDVHRLVSVIRECIHG